MSKRIRKNADIPNQMPEDGRYIPPPAKLQDEIELRRSWRPGTLTLREQTVGMFIGARVLSRCVRSTRLLEEASSFFALPMIATARELTVDSTDTRRRVASLPQIDYESLGFRQPTSYRVAMMASHRLYDSAAASHVLAANYLSGEAKGKHDTRRIQLARQSANTGLMLRAVTLADVIGWADPFDAAEIISDASQDAIVDSITVHSGYNQMETMAAFARKTTDASLRLMREGSSDLVSIFEQTQSELVGAA